VSPTATPSQRSLDAGVGGVPTTAHPAVVTKRSSALSANDPRTTVTAAVRFAASPPKKSPEP